MLDETFKINLIKKFKDFFANKSNIPKNVENIICNNMILNEQNTILYFFINFSNYTTLYSINIESFNDNNIIEIELYKEDEYDHNKKKKINLPNNCKYLKMKGDTLLIITNINLYFIVCKGGNKIDHANHVINTTKNLKKAYILNKINETNKDLTSHIIQADFHPLSNSHLIILYSNYTLSLINLSIQKGGLIEKIYSIIPYDDDDDDDHEIKKKKVNYISFTTTYHIPLLTSNKSNDNNEMIQLNTFLWHNFTIFLLLENGGICTLSPIIPDNIQISKYLIDSLKVNTHNNSLLSKWLTTHFQLINDYYYISINNSSNLIPSLQGPYYNHDHDMDDDIHYQSILIINSSLHNQNNYPLIISTLGISNTKCILSIYTSMKAIIPILIDLDQEEVEEVEDDDETLQSLIQVHEESFDLNTNNNQQQSNYIQLYHDKNSFNSFIIQISSSFYMICLPWINYIKDMMYQMNIKPINTDEYIKYINHAICEKIPLYIKDEYDDIIKVKAETPAYHGICILSNPLLGNYILLLDHMNQLYITMIQSYQPASINLINLITNNDQDDVVTTTNQQQQPGLLTLDNDDDDDNGKQQQQQQQQQQGSAILANVLQNLKQASIYIQTIKKDNEINQLQIDNENDYSKFLIFIEYFKNIKSILIRSKHQLQFICNEINNEAIEQLESIQYIIKMFNKMKHFLTILKKQIYIHKKYDLTLKSDLKKLLILHSLTKKSSKAIDLFMTYIKNMQNITLNNINEKMRELKQDSHQLIQLRQQKQINQYDINTEKINQISQILIKHTKELNNLANKIEKEQQLQL